MQEILPRNINIYFPGWESFSFLKGVFPWQGNPSLLKKKFPTREITSLAVKLFPNIGEFAKMYASLSGKSLVGKKNHPGRVSDKKKNIHPLNATIGAISRNLSFYVSSLANQFVPPLETPS